MGLYVSVIALILLRTRHGKNEGTIGINVSYAYFVFFSVRNNLRFIQAKRVRGNTQTMAVICLNILKHSLALATIYGLSSLLLCIALEYGLSHD